MGGSLGGLPIAYAPRPPVNSTAAFCAILPGVLPTHHRWHDAFATYQPLIPVSNTQASGNTLAFNARAGYMVSLPWRCQCRDRPHRWGAMGP